VSPQRSVRAILKVREETRPKGIEVSEMIEHTKIAFAPPLQDRLDRYFLDLGMGVNASRLVGERREILCWLNAKSDAELALVGLSRRDIPAFVFRDLFGP
jgi:hypothetical protein